MYWDAPSWDPRRTHSATQLCQLPLGLLCPCWPWQLPRKYSHARKSWGCRAQAPEIAFERLILEGFSPPPGLQQAAGWEHTASGHQPGSSFLGHGGPATQPRVFGVTSSQG